MNPSNATSAAFESFKVKKAQREIASLGKTKSNCTNTAAVFTLQNGLTIQFKGHISLIVIDHVLSPNMSLYLAFWQAERVPPCPFQGSEGEASPPAANPPREESSLPGQQ